MKILYGARLYGKVHTVPGVFYVSTSFFHVLLVPIVPTHSFIVLDSPLERRNLLGAPRKGVALRHIHWQSVLMAWLRYILLLGSTGAALALALLVALRSAPLLITVAASLALGGALALALSYRAARASLSTLDRLAKVPGVPSELLASARLLMSRRRRASQSSFKEPSVG